jgi:hypothetical protein
MGLSWDDFASGQTAAAPAANPAVPTAPIEPARDIGGGAFTNLSPAEYQAFMARQEQQPAQPVTQAPVDVKPLAEPAKTGISWQEFNAPPPDKSQQGSKSSGGLIDLLSRGFTGGLDRVVAPAIAAPFVAPFTGESLGTAYDRLQGGMDQGRKDYIAQNPMTGTAGELAGAIASPMMQMGSGLFNTAKVSGVIPRALKYGQNVLASGAMGAPFGFMMGEGGFDNRMNSAKDAALMGLGFGAAAPAIGAIVKAPFQVASRLAAPLRAGGPEVLAGKALSEAAGGPLNYDQSPIAGWTPNAPQATGNAGWAALFRNRSNVDQNAGAAAKTADNQALNDLLTGRNTSEPALGHGASSADSAAGFTNSVRNAHQNVFRAEENRLWNVPELATENVDHSVVQNAVANTMASLAPGLKASMTGRLNGIVQELQAMPRATIGDLNAARSELLNIGRTSQDGSERAIARRLSNAFMDGIAHIPQIAGSPARTQYFAGGKPIPESEVPNWHPSVITQQFVPGIAPDPKMVQAYQTARNFTRQGSRLFGTQDMRQILNKNASGVFTQDASTGADPFFQFSRGSPEGAANIMAATDFLGRIRGAHEAAAGAAKQEIIDHARDFVIARARELASGRVLDQEGTRLLQPNALNKWISANRPWIERTGMFSPAQVDLIGRIEKMTEMMARTENVSPVRGSPTYSFLSTGNFLDGILGPVLAKGVGATLGAVTGHLTGEGAFLGAMAGHGVQHGFAGLYNAPREAALTLIDAGLRDPKVAADLMKKASLANVAFFSPETKAAFLQAGIALPTIARTEIQSNRR